MKSEVGALRKLNHPNLVNPVSVVISAKQTIGFIVPYHEDGNLYQYLLKTRTTVSRMTKISLLHDVACGMRYIHDQTIIHGDLKVENVLVSVNRNTPIAKVWYSAFNKQTRNIKLMFFIGNRRIYTFYFLQSRHYWYFDSETIASLQLNIIRNMTK